MALVDLMYWRTDMTKEDKGSFCELFTWLDSKVSESRENLVELEGWLLRDRKFPMLAPAERQRARLEDHEERVARCVLTLARWAMWRDAVGRLIQQPKAAEKESG